MEQISVLCRLVVTISCLLCLGFGVGICSELDPLIQTYVSSSFPSTDGLLYSAKLQGIQSISDESEWSTLVMGSKVPVMVMFEARWCAPCRAMSPILDQLNSEYRTRFKFYTLDIDDVPDMITRYHLVAIPTFVVFKYGEEMATLIGPHSKDKLLGIIKPYV